MFCLSNILDQEKHSKYKELVHNHENKEYVYIGKNQYGNLLFFSLTIQANAMGEGVVVVCTRRIGSLCGTGWLSKVAASHSNDNKSWLEEIWATAEKQQCQFWKTTSKVLTTCLVEIKTISEKKMVINLKTTAIENVGKIQTKCTQTYKRNGGKSAACW